MKYIVATSDRPYFRWQMLVQINNFKRLGMLDDLIYVVSKSERRSKYLGYIEEETGVKIFDYKDEREDTSYTPSVTAHVMKKFVRENPEYAECFFYLDPDLLFYEKIKFNDLIYRTDHWFLSDTKSYIDSRYIKSKSDVLFIEMCNVVGIDPKVVEKNDPSAGGAQYIMKNTNYEYWDKVEKDSIMLYNLMDDTKRVYSPEHPIQAWTAEMWAVLWNAWYFNHKTIIIDMMRFSWATDKEKSIGNKKIMHNAGVVDQENLFNKGMFSNKHPFDADFSHVSDEYVSKFYVNEIIDTKNNFSDLIKKL